MKNRQLFLVLILVFVIAVSLTSWHCAKKENNLSNKENGKYSNEKVLLSFDSTLVETFYAKYPKLVTYKKQTTSLYKKNQYSFIWYDKKGRKETADVIYNKINNLFEEGLETKVPYKSELDAMFQKTTSKPNIAVELFLTNYFFFIQTKFCRDLTKQNQMI